MNTFLPNRISVLFCGTLLSLLVTTYGQAAQKGDTLALKNDRVQRELQFDGSAWRTVRFARGDGSDAVTTVSEEFHVQRMDGSGISLEAYFADADPVRVKGDAEESVTVHYKLRVGAKYPANTPSAVTIVYTLSKDGYLRKSVTLQLQKDDVIDRLEVERFSTAAPAMRGGRGEPVFVDSKWFFGVEYPAFYSRHTDGNTPAAASGPYDKYGNYSSIDLDGRDADTRPAADRKGAVRLMHFPGNAKLQPDGSYAIVSKPAVAGIGDRSESIELAFMDSLGTIRRPVRSFIHYNNWYDADGKKLTVDNFVKGTFLPFKEHLSPYGVRIDAMVPDDGWQDRKSIYQLNPTQFPGGMDDLAKLGDALRGAGTGLGLWIALNGYNSDIDWGKSQGYAEATRNTYFTKFKRYYALAEPKYNAEIRARITDLMKRGQIAYFKHDFNEMCDAGESAVHPPTDRHGHEASVDAELGILALERELNPKIYQNITNWIWFSPWWLQNGNNVWMLSGDSGEFNGWPELSLLVRATSYRDVNLYPAWHDASTRPLVPISHLMTHGIIYTKSKYSAGGDSLRDFSDYVMMYYMRGLQLKEWYINPKILSAEQWQALGRATRWSEENVETLANAVLVGGNPAKGEPYGYVCWKGERGIVSMRNPSPGEAEIAVPFDRTVWYRGAAGKPFHARVVYPYQSELGATFRSGQAMKVKVPGYTVMVMQLEAGESDKSALAAPAAVVVRGEVKDGSWNGSIAVPGEAMQRCDLLVIARPGGGRKTAAAPEVHIGEQVAEATRKADGTQWSMLAYDLRGSRGKDVKVSIKGGGGATPDAIEAWVLMDRPVAGAPPADADVRLPFPVSHGFVRQTVLLTR